MKQMEERAENQSRAAKGLSRVAKKRDEKGINYKALIFMILIFGPTLFGGASRVPSPTKNNPDRHQIKSKDGAPPLFSSAIDQGMEPTDFLGRLFEILERTATEIREAHARK